MSLPLSTSMSIEEQTRVDVDRRIQHLREKYGAFKVIEETVENDPEFFEQGRELAVTGWRGDAGAWITDDKQRVLLIRHAAAPNRWGIPGGGHAPNESHEETARREVHEETGIECTLTDVFRVRRKEILLETDHSQRLYMLTVNFEGTTGDSDIDISDDEILEARWFAESPEDGVAAFLENKINEWANGR